MTQVTREREYATTSPVAQQHVHVSWRAIFAGILVALAVDLLLTLLGFAVGLTAFQPTAGATKGVGMGLGIWLIITAIASVFAGAYFGSRVAGDPWRGDGIAHGVMVWAGFTILSLWLVGSGIGKVVGGVANVAGGAIGAASSPDAHERAVATLTQLGYSRAEAEQMASQAKRAAPAIKQPGAEQQAEESAKKAADQVAAGGAVASWVGFGIILLSLGGGVLGGMLGAIGEEKQVVRYTRRFVTTEPTHAEPFG
jgi:hypothetical protein